MTRMLIVCLLSLAACAAFGYTETLVFDFDTQTSPGSVDLDGKETGTTTVAGTLYTVTITASAVGPGVSNVFNINNDGTFGINVVDDGGDNSIQIDGNSGAESMVFCFDRAGTITLLDLGALTNEGGDGEDVGNISFARTTANDRDFNGGTMDDGAQDTWIVSMPFEKNESITLSWVQGNGFYIDSFQVEFIPEPASFLLVVLGILPFFRRREQYEGVKV